MTMKKLKGAKTGLYSVSDSLTYKGINGILSGKGGFNASAQKGNSVKVLHELLKKIGTEAFAEWGLGILDTFQQEKVLRQVLHGDSVRQQTSKEEPAMGDSSPSCEKDLPERELLGLWETWQNGRTPQGQRLEEQFTRELTEALSKLSHENTPQWRIRRLTPKETERLQGFPDDWTRYADTGKEMSDASRYKACGNAVTVNVIEAIIRRLL